MEISSQMLRFYVLTRVKCDVECWKSIHDDLVNSWPEHAPTLTTVQLLVKQFREGARTSLDDEKRLGRPRTSTDSKCKADVVEAVEIDPFLCQRRIAADDVRRKVEFRNYFTFEYFSTGL